MEEEVHESERFLTQALPVADLKDDVDLNIPPSTGEEYLSRVRFEALKCPDIVIAKVDLEKYKKKQTPQYVQQIPIGENRSEFKAPIEWQREKSAEFSNLRLKCERERARFKMNNPLKKVKLPNTNNKNEWFTFCFGKYYGKSIKPTELNEAHKPLLSYLYKMDQAAIIQVFDYHVEWFEEFGYSKESFEWLYCLMCFLEKPLIPETYSSLRNLARLCIKLRSDLKDPNDECLVEFNLFVSIIGRYFEQFDLADDS